MVNPEKFPRLQRLRLISCLNATEADIQVKNGLHVELFGIGTEPSVI